MSGEVKKYKPVMTEKKEIDSKLFNDLKFLLLELREVSPFFGILASEMFLAGPSTSISTIAVSHRGVVVYNEDFMRKLTPGERIAVFVHEALHVSLDYWDRFMGRNWKIANWAHDFVINDIIVKGMADIEIVRKGGKERFQLKVKLPEGGAWSQEFDNMSGEEVYNIIFKKAQARSKEIKDQYHAMMADPAARAENERKDAINKELRKSVQAGGKLLTEKQDEATSKTKIADEEVRKANDSFMEALRDSESLTMTSRPEQYVAPEKKEPEPEPEAKQPDQTAAEPKAEDPKDQQPSDQSPQEQSEDTHQPDEPDQDNEQQPEDQSAEGNEGADPGQGQDPGEGQGGDQPSSEGAEQGQESGKQSDNGQPGQGSQASSDAKSGSDNTGIESAGQDGSRSSESSESSPSDQAQPGQPEGGDLNPYEQAKKGMQDSMNQSFNDYVSKERDRISQEVDGTPSNTSREQHLQELSDELDKIGDEYVDNVTKAREEGHPEPKPGEEGESQNNPGEQGGEPEAGQKGEGAEGQEGQDGPDGSGEAEAGGDKPGQGEEAGGELSENGQGNSEPGQGDQPGQGQGQGQGNEPGQGDQPGQGQGQGSQPGQGGSQGQGGQSGQGGAQGQSDPVSEKTARTDVQQTIEQMIEQLSNSLGGRPKGMDGLDQQMASDQDAANIEGFEQAMRELQKEYGSNMDGDVDMDCSDIEGNPFVKETPEQLDERRRQMLTRAAMEDQQHGGKTMGTLPGWFKSEINNILYPPMSFAQELEKFLGPYGVLSQRSFSVRNKRNTFWKDHLVRPGMKKNSGKVYVLLDVSGSMMSGQDAENLMHGMGLVDQLATALRLEVCVIQCDTDVTKVMTTQEALEEVRAMKFEVKGQGGSNLEPAFEHIWKEMMIENGNRGNAIICFTDGVIHVPEEVPPGLRQQCMWVTNPGQSAPTKNWGEHVIMRDL